MTDATLPVRASGPGTTSTTKVRRAASACAVVCVLVALGSCTHLPTTPGTDGGTQVAWRQISAGSDFTCALAESGKAYCWGLGSDGQLGAGASCAGLLDCSEGYGHSVRPVPVAGGYRFTSITAGWYHACGLTGNGQAYCWGAGYDGQLGNGLGQTSVTPTLVSGGHKFRAISAGWYHVCAIDLSGEAYCWGAGFSGQLGNGGYVDTPIPTRVQGDHVFATISSGAHTCGLTPDRAVFCWGEGGKGQLGNGATETSPVPVRVVGDHQFVALSTGDSSTCGLDLSGTIFCWGDASFDQLGNGSRTSSPVPIAVAGQNRYTSLSVATLSCATTAEAAAYCWGRDVFNALPGSSAGPVLVSDGLRFNRISVGVAHVCALSPDGVAYCWGDNGSGAVGNGSLSFQIDPSRVVAPAGLHSAG